MSLADERPQTHWATADDGVHIAYQVLGDGPVDVVFCPPPFSHVEARWGIESYARFLLRMASFSRLIMFDKRGFGLSDRVGPPPTLEQQMDDVRVVMDTVGSDAAAVVGYMDGGVLGLLLAAAHPERTTALALYATPARFVVGPDYPWGFPQEWFDQLARAADTTFSLDPILDALAPARGSDPAVRDAFNTLARMAMGPGGLPNLLHNMLHTDVTSVLPTVRRPTLFIGRSDDRWYPPELGRWMAAQVPGARFVEIEGGDTLLFGDDFELLADEVEDFLTGRRPVPHTDRILTTVLFTDIVGSTEMAARLGDAAWRQLLDRHDALVRRQLERFRGREVNTTGDGFMATFDGPARAVRCAQAVVSGARSLSLELRVGLHTGECEVRGDDLSGLAVHVAARIASLAGAGEVLVSQTVRDLVAGAGIEFEDRGSRTLKGVPHEVGVLAVTS